MPRAGRLTTTADFRRTYAAGRRISTRAVVVHVNATDEPRPARIGVSAGVSTGNAVERNRSKRRLREAIRPLRGALGNGVDAVFVATAATRSCAFQELVDSARGSVAKAGALHG